MSGEHRPGYTGGILNLSGVRPGAAFAYDGPTMTDMTVYSVVFESSYEAIERLILPPPLKVDRDLPPLVRTWYFVNPRNRAIDGRTTPYQAFQFFANARYDDAAGLAGWEYVDGVYGDKTEIDVMGPWGVYFGMAKKLGDIRYTPTSPDECEISVVRRGIRVATMRMRIGREMSPEDTAALDALPKPQTLTVREIPDPTYTGFADRSICISPTNVSNRIDRAWEADRASIEFGHLELDPLDELPVLGIASAIAAKVTVTKETFTGMRVLARLPDELK